MKILPIWSGVADLGEGCLWHPIQNFLYWIDILHKDLYCYQPKTNKVERWAMPDHISCISPLKNKGHLIATVGNAIVKIELPSGKLTKLQTAIDSNLKQRINDGKCDASGRLWFGTITSDNQIYNGGLYCFDGKNIVKKQSHLSVSNGLGWSPDNKTFYHTDSTQRTIYSYDFDQASGDISHQREFFSTAHIDAKAQPDGLTIDSEGNLWIAMWDGWSLLQVSPEGSLIKKIDMPVQRPTCVTFGGEDLSILYVTSASKDFGEAQRLSGAMAGAVFAIETNVKGMKAYCFG
ncbi:MAG: hypothetical protein A3F17_04835 [Gammaproteobacteria bacterium RIFCSPHIGHO2_12_FULL_41_15]|nr:MAG: hypothetical protein A3F17_04835 [Gammaproteobacteria bacterium RIFCSPHIGHO2_12_FULL_41_15]